MENFFKYLAGLIAAAVVGLLVLLILVFLGFKLTNVSVNVGPVGVGLDPPEEIELPEIELPDVGVVNQSAPTSSSNDILFSDDFSNENSGWDRVRVSDGITDYLYDQYQIQINTPSTDIWANPGKSFGNIKIDVDARKVSGSDDNDFGVICRFVDNSNFYFFIISSDGYYGIGKVSNGSQTLLGNADLMSHEAIKTGSNVTNHIQAICDGSNLSFYVNGMFVQSVTDSDYSKGDIGLMAGTFETPGTNIYFDNLTVRKP